MNIRQLMADGVDVDAEFEFISVVQNSAGEPIKTHNKPVFEIDVTEEGVLQIKAVYEIESAGETNAAAQWAAKLAASENKAFENALKRSKEASNEYY